MILTQLHYGDRNVNDIIFQLEKEGRKVYFTLIMTNKKNKDDKKIIRTNVGTEGLREIAETINKVLSKIGGDDNTHLPHLNDAPPW